ncbi:MAG: hypothetical protein KF813_09215 [Trueperaceae bacterium]|nr:hypothetical protein [Trueperaceae bacterium]
MPDPSAAALGVAGLARAYRSGELDPVRVTEEYLKRIAAHPHGGSVYRCLTADRAFRQAAQAARQFEAGVDVGPLQGVPIAIKDLLDTEGEVSAAGSRVMLDRPPAAQDSPVAARLDAAGAVFLGRTNMTELAYSGIGVNPHFGTPPCALDDQRVPGGSSSGSGVAVAAHLAACAVGSDTGGSVRIPASVNGVVGLKTTDGRIPTSGAVALSTTLDTIGPLARDADDAWALFCAMAAEEYKPLRPVHRKLTLLAPTTVVTEELDPEVASAYEAGLEHLQSLGHEVRVTDLPLLTEVAGLYPRYGSFASHESWALYERELTERGAEMDPRVVTRIAQYAGKPAADYIRLGYARKSLIERFWPELHGIDAVVAPTLPILPPRFSDLVEDAGYFHANGMILRNTALFNILGSPAASVPCGLTAGGLSVGLMVVTRPGDDELALAIAKLMS